MKQSVASFTSNNGKQAQAFDGPDIIDFLDMYLRAKDAGALLPSQAHLADTAYSIIRSVAKVGIVALIDEATGFQEIREKDALRLFLEKFLRDDYASWSKKFPDEYYREIYRLNNWEWKVDQSSGKRIYYSVIERWTNDIIYSRLGPKVLEELKIRNPKTSRGSRLVKHHQWLSADLGHPKLNDHFSGILALMRSTEDGGWADFLRKVRRAYPAFGDQLDFL